MPPCAATVCERVGNSLVTQAVVSWMAQESTALLLILFILVATWHSQLGVRVVVEDYVHGGTKTLTLVVFTFIHAVVAAAGIFAVLKVAFGGAA